MRRWRLIVAVIAVLAIILIGWYLLTRPAQKTSYFSGPVIANVQYPYLADSSTIYYFTGTAFAKYSPRKGATETISPQFALPALSDLRWSRNAVIFSASSYDPGDDLYQALQTMGLGTDGIYWWKYDFSSRKISLLLNPNVAGRVTDARWLDDSSDVYAFTLNDASIYYSNNTKEPVVRPAGGVGVISFANKSQVLYQSAGGSAELKKYDLTSHQTSTLFSADYQDLQVGAGGGYLTYTTDHPKNATGDTPGTLYVYDIGTKKKHQIQRNFVGKVSSNSRDSVLINVLDPNGQNVGEFWRYDTSSSRLTQYRLDLKGFDATAQSVIAGSDGGFFAVNSNRQFLAVSTQQEAQPIIPNNAIKLQDDFYKDGFSLNYRSDSDIYIVTITKDPYGANQRRALDFIKSNGVDINQIQIQWRRGDGVPWINPGVNTALPNYPSGNEG